MESVIQLLSRQEIWEEFLAHRLMKGRFTWRGFDEADAYVEGEDYLPVAEQFAVGEGPGVPEKKVVNKMGTGKKRIVYSFSPGEMTVLKMLSHLLYKYDGRFAKGCYAFRRGIKATDAIFHIRKALRGQPPMWAYKLDIHDYFNSISIPILLPILKDLLADDPPLYSFFERMLLDGRALHKGELIRENRGVMAGTPTAPFLADVYLMEVDHYFADAGVLYARYSDDIILFASDRETLDGYRKTLLGFLEKYKLTVNPDKERLFAPEEGFEFLGFMCRGNSIDIAESTKRKMKLRIRRTARSLHRWRSAKGLAPEQAVKAMIRIFNEKFFGDGDSRTLSWSRWFFPVITRADGLREIDRYLQQYIRFLSTGRHTKANYRLRYTMLKELGYRSLVNEYYKNLLPLDGCRRLG